MYVVQTLILASVLLYTKRCYADLECKSSKDGEWLAYPRNGNCYRVFTTARSWSDALSRCNQPFSSTLLELDNAEDSHFIREFVLSFKGGTYWMGLGNMCSYLLAYHGVNGTEHFKAGSILSNSSDSYVSGSCILINRTSLQYEESACSTGSGFICRGKINETQSAADLKGGYPSEGCMGTNAIRYKMYRTPKPFEEAVRDCRSEGGDLASLHSMAEKNETSLIAKPFFDQVYSFWIGLNRRIPRLGWSWTDGSPVDFLNWLPGQPDSGSFAGVESCAEMLTQTQLAAGSWNDLRCDISRSYICQFRDTPSSAPVRNVQIEKLTVCPHDWIRYENRCFKLYDNVTLNYPDAHKFCRNISSGANLVSILNAYDQAFLQTLLPNRNVWIGLASYVSYELTGGYPKFLWNDESTIGYTKWGDIQNPKTVPGRDDITLALNTQPYMLTCVTIDGSNGFWYRTALSDCNNLTLNFVCSEALNINVNDNNYATEIFSAGDMGRRKGDKYTFYGVHDSDYIVQYYEAKKLCTSQSSTDESYNLISITYRYELSLTTAHAHKARRVGFNEFWIGLENVNDSGIFEWSDGWPVRLSLWAANQPLIGVGKNCVKMVLNRADDYTKQIGAEWFTADCSEPHPFICKRTTERPPKIIFSGKCQKNWTEGPTGCYFIESTTQLSMSEAAISQCQLRHNKSNLASFHSAEEMKLIASLHPIHMTSKRYFIGLMRYSEGIFAWLDGTPLNYLNWAPDQPANYDEQSACVEIDNLSQWHIVSCHAKRNFICFLPKTEVDTHQLKANSSQFGKERQNSTLESTQSRMPNATNLTNTTVERDVSASSEGMTPGQIFGIIFGVLIAAGLLFGLHIAYQRQLIVIPCLSSTPIGATRPGSYYDNPVHFYPSTTEF